MLPLDLEDVWSGNYRHASVPGGRPPVDALGEHVARLIVLAAVGVTLLGVTRLLLVLGHLGALDGWAPGELLHLGVVGGRLDLAAFSFLLGPASLVLLMPARLRSRSMAALSGAFLAIAVLDAVFEFCFFQYFGARPNHLVLEHASDPEVMRVAASYVTPAGVAVLAAIAVSTAWCVARLSRGLSRLLPVSTSGLRTRAVWCLGLVAVFGVAARGTLDHRPINPSVAAVGTNRVANELAGSGMFTLGYLAAHLRSRARNDLAELHELPDRTEAESRLLRLYEGSGSPLEDGSPPLRVVHQPRRDRPLSVVLVVMESFTGRLVGSLGGELALSPELDALAERGLLLTDCYATGERTVQGLEASVSSFPPLPGESVVRRPEAQQGFETLASVLGRRGYESVFLYGGQGIFDHMRSFFLGNGFQRFIEERDFDSASFRGTWGVSDEDLFRRANEEFEARWKAGRPFLGVILTVSLHSPWEFPKGRAPDLPPDVEVPDGFERAELANFLYADFAVGEFMREARRLDYSRDTLFVFVGDHGVHLRGAALLPADEYRVPALFLPPGQTHAQRIDTVSSQLDIAPTIMGYLGGTYRSTFYGHDVRSRDPGSGLAVMVYRKRDYGVRRAGRLSVLRADGGLSSYRLVPGAEPRLVPSAPAFVEDARDALAMLQRADAQRRNGAFTTARPPDQLSARGSSPPAQPVLTRTW